MTGRPTLVPLMALAFRVGNSAAVTADDIGALARASMDAYSLIEEVGRSLSDAEALLFAAANIMIERGPDEHTRAALRAGVVMVARERAEAAEPGTPQSRAAYWWQEGQMA